MTLSIRGQVGQVWTEKPDGSGNILLVSRVSGDSWACLITYPDGRLEFAPKVSLDATGRYACQRIA